MPRTFRTTLAFFLYLLAGPALLTIPAPAQAAKPTDAGKKKDVKFEVASIRLAGPNAGQWQTFSPTPDGFTSQLSVAQMIMLAYAPYGTFQMNGLGLTRVSLEPRWIYDWYVINARVSDDDREAWRNQGKQQELLKAALRNLLKERFKLVLHEEPTAMDGFQLVVANKKGPTLKASIPGAVLPTGVGELSGGVMVGKVEGNHHSWSFYASTMEDLARFLMNSTNGPVGDMTGLPAHYDFTLRSVDLRDYSTHGEGMEDNWPLDSLGLTLKRGKVPGLALVIDHIEKPTPN